MAVAAVAVGGDDDDRRRILDRDHWRQMLAGGGFVR